MSLPSFHTLIIASSRSNSRKTADAADALVGSLARMTVAEVVKNGKSFWNLKGIEAASATAEAPMLPMTADDVAF